jgi:hypothetical protein
MRILDGSSKSRTLLHVDSLPTSQVIRLASNFPAPSAIILPNKPEYLAAACSAPANLHAIGVYDDDIYTKTMPRPEQVADYARAGFSALALPVPLLKIKSQKENDKREAIIKLVPNLELIRQIKEAAGSMSLIAIMSDAIALEWLVSKDSTRSFWVTAGVCFNAAQLRALQAPLARQLEKIFYYSKPAHCVSTQEIRLAKKLGAEVIAAGTNRIKSDQTLSTTFYGLNSQVHHAFATQSDADPQKLQEIWN